MPEGDTIFRAARTLHRALAGTMVVAFDSVLPALNSRIWCPRCQPDESLRA